MYRCTAPWLCGVPGYDDVLPVHCGGVRPAGQPLVNTPEGGPAGAQECRKSSGFQECRRSSVQEFRSAAGVQKCSRSAGVHELRMEQVNGS